MRKTSITLGLVAAHLFGAALHAQQLPAPSTALPAPVLPVNGFIVKMLPADLDANGLQDIALITNNNHLWLLLSDGEGGMSGFRHAPAVSGALIDLAVLDWNHDGWDDVASLSDTGSVRVLLGDGAGGSLGDVQALAADTPGLALRAGDFDGDDNDDLVLSTSLPPRLRILRGNGSGGVLSEHTHLTPGLASTFQIGDVDLDGAPDILASITDLGAEGLVLLFGDGSGAFPSSSFYAHVGDTHHVLLADVDNDGFLDVAAARLVEPSAEFPWRLELRLNLGNGTLGPASTLHEQGTIHDLTAGDFFRDGNLDLVLASQSTSNAFVYRGHGNGAFDAATELRTSPNASRVLALDFDGDGLSDLAHAPFGGVVLATGTGAGTLRQAHEHSASSILRALRLGDLDGDGLLDAVTAGEFSDCVSVFPGLGGERFGEPTSYPVSDPSGTGSGVALGDLDNDGALDVVVAREELVGGVSVLLNDGAGGLLPSVVHATGANTTEVELADINRDGQLDVLALDRGSQRLTLLLGDGEAGFAAPRHWVVPFQSDHFSLGDVNGDTFLDVVVVSHGATQLTTLHGTAAGGLALASSLEVGPEAIAVALADFDLDGDLDLAIARNVENNTVRVYANNGLGSFSFVSEMPGGEYPAHMVAGDLDADGRPDLVVATLNSIHVLHGTGDLGFLPASRHLMRSAELGTPTKLRLADLEGAGAPDVLCVTYQGTLQVLPNRVSPWFQIGGDAPGGPRLSAVGALTPGAPLTLSIAGGTPSGTLALVLGLDVLLAPRFTGGVLIPSLDLVKLFPLDGNGALSLASSWPAGVPAQTPMWLQAWSIAPALPGETLLGISR
ncbi:MAG: hypothetical protein DHS20C15_32060 [Planctomycetota bacterium]|nr:MAG: hypothetical protein DHS20C15_32060 [Planctomycetota bacterium]